MKTILFLDAGERSTLSVIRSIGKLGKYKIITAGTSKCIIGKYSRYSNGHLVYGDPAKSKINFVETLTNIISTKNPDYIFPCSDITLLAIYTSDIYDQFKHKLIAPEKEAFLKVFDKKTMNEIAKLYHINVAKNIPINEIDVRTFPFVVKPSKSRYYIDDRMLKGFRCFVSDKQMLAQTLGEINNYEPAPLLQEIIKGKGYGIFTGAKEGKMFAVFAHERIREIPPEGGESTMRKSISPNKILLEAAEKLIKDLNWTGIAMIEFKGECEERACFMEINGRPWGSMDLAVSSGMDFPQMMIDIFIEKLNYDQLLNKYDKKYALEHYSCWIIGEINYIKYVIKSKRAIKEKWKEISAMLINKPKKISYDTFRLNDPLPFIVEFLFALRKLLKFNHCVL